MHLHSLLKHLALFELWPLKDGHQVHLGNICANLRRVQAFQKESEVYIVLDDFLGFSEIKKKRQTFQNGWGEGEKVGFYMILLKNKGRIFMIIQYFW